MRLSNVVDIASRRIARYGFARSKGLIFVIGHMRSFSTLLSHQIGSNPDVSGYIEAHQKYRTWLDVIELAHKIDLAGGHPPPGRFLLDKILHPLEIRDAILQRRDLKIILMVREPAPTVRSIVKLGSGGKSTFDDAADYYAQRLDQLSELFERRNGRLLYLEAEALIENSAATLASITQYLGLGVPLTDEYRLFPMTGKAKFGDSSKWISHGAIVTRREQDAVASVGSPRLESLRTKYEEFRRDARNKAEHAVLRGAECRWQEPELHKEKTALALSANHVG